MIRPIMKDPIFLAQKSAPATPEDLTVAWTPWRPIGRAVWAWPPT